MALVEPMEKKLEQVRAKYQKELKNPMLTLAEKKVLKKDIKALTAIIQVMKKEMKLTNHNVC